MSANTDTQKSDTARREEEILAFWNEQQIFEKTLSKEAPEGEYTFYDGPPFATGTPHYGHLVASVIKDAVPRYKTMRGYHVARQWGWDCHGLPIENIVEKELGTKSKRDILEIGVKKFNELCREKIFTYVDVWNTFIPRFGRWADMENPYRTMDKDYMESEWWAFKTLYEKELVYEDYRSMHVCPRCETTLAQSEVAEGYKDVKDLTVTAKFELVEEPGTFFLAWTTTPWTLPGNVALAVGEDIEYVGFKYPESDEIYISSLSYFKKGGNGTSLPSLVATYKGKELVGKAYTSPFDAYTKDEKLKNKENAWKVYAADFVTTEEGTGIVHIAPAFGQDDLTLAQKCNLPMVQHVGMDGIIKPEVTELAGRSVKPIDDHQATDVEVVKYLAGKGLLFAKEKYEHSYPHCWRCDTPLINYATSSWFVAVEKIKQELLQKAEAINWSPAHIKQGRWGQWLQGARDWSISRQRFWANTIPVWRCQACAQDRVFGSASELEEASGTTVTDLHKDVVDDITVPCACGSTMHRVPDVLDTWFDSGSVAFASYHYPFESEDIVEKRIPVDFIAEGQDQVSKWFYYQHVLGTALFESNMFSNVITNGIVLAEDGKKMSKRLQNYPDPQAVIDRYGADAARLYLLTSPVVRAENLNFSEQSVAQTSSKVIGRLTNVYSFYELYKADVAHEPNSDSTNVLDRWIIARMQELHREVTKAMDAYELDRATRPLGDFIDDLSTWYLRRSRERLKSDNQEDKQAALATLQWVLRKYAKVSAPFTPFSAEWLWQRVRREDDVESVHLANWCTVREPDANVLEAMALTRTIVSDALEARAQAGIKIRQPLQTLRMSHELPTEYHALIADEVNVKELHVDMQMEETVQLDTAITDELRIEGIVRDIVRDIQGARKEAAFLLSEQGIITVNGPAETLAIAATYKTDIETQTNTVLRIGATQDVLEVAIARQ